MKNEFDTRTRIKSAARRLVAERGVEAVTVREIVAAAKAKNGGSLNYYFGSKEGLIAELVSDVLKEVSVLWLEGLSTLEKSGGPKSVRDIVDVLISPQGKLIDEDPHPTSSRFVASVLITRRRMVRELMQRLDYLVFARLLNYIKELKPEIPTAVMQQRLVFFAWYLVSVQSAYESFVAERGRSKVWTDFDPRVNMIDAGTGLLEAPVSNAEAKRVKRPAAARGKTPTSAPAPENRVHPKPVRAGKPKVTKDVAEPQAKNPPARKPPVTAPAARKTKAKPSVG